MANQAFNDDIFSLLSATPRLVSDIIAGLRDGSTGRRWRNIRATDVEDIIQGTGYLAYRAHGCGSAAYAASGPFAFIIDGRHNKSRPVAQNSSNPTILAVDGDHNHLARTTASQRKYNADMEARRAARLAQRKADTGLNPVQRDILRQLRIAPDGMDILIRPEGASSDSITDLQRQGYIQAESDESEIEWIATVTAKGRKAVI